MAESPPDLVICELDCPQGATLAGRVLADHIDVPCLVLTEGGTAGFEDLARLHDRPPGSWAIVSNAEGRLLQRAIVDALLTRLGRRPRAQSPRPATDVPLHDAAFREMFWTGPHSDLVLTPALEVVAVSREYASDVGRAPGTLIGGRLFELFPDNPDYPAADGVANLQRSLANARARRVPETMRLQRYDVRANGVGPFLESWWHPVNYPVCVGNALVYFVHRVFDVTRFVKLERFWQAQALGAPA